MSTEQTGTAQTDPADAGSVTERLDADAYEDATPYEEPGHGDSPAAWTAVVVMLIAVAAGTVFFYLDMPILVWASVGLLLIGALLGLVLKKLGFGVNGSRWTPKGH